MNNPFDLKEVLPDYFNKWVFRYAVLCVIILFVFTADSNNWRNEFVYVTCPANAYDGCLIVKDQITNNEHFPNEWDGIFLASGETIGEKPNEHYFSFKSRTWLIVAFAFIINHLLFMLRTKKLLPQRRKK